MSNPFKKIGKIFKAVVKVVKKVALPALAIGAVVLTGGAALGALPKVGAVLGKLGLSPGLTSVLSTAAKGATIGAVGSALTGGNIVKGATTGFVTGGLLGGANAALGGAKGLGTAAAGGGSSSAASNALNVIDNGKIAAMGSGAGSAATQGLGSAVASTGLGNVATAAAPVASAAVPSSGGILGFMNQNPVMAGLTIQGLGQGLMAREQAKQQERDAAQTAANYSDLSGLPRYVSQGNSFAPASEVFNSAIYAGKRVTLDPKTGLKVVGG